MPWKISMALFKTASVCSPDILLRVLVLLDLTKVSNPSGEHARLASRLAVPDVSMSSTIKLSSVVIRPHWSTVDFRRMNVDWVSQNIWPYVPVTASTISFKRLLCSWQWSCAAIKTSLPMFTRLKTDVTAVVVSVVVAVEVRDVVAVADADEDAVLDCVVVADIDWVVLIVDDWDDVAVVLAEVDAVEVMVEVTVLAIVDVCVLVFVVVTVEERVLDWVDDRVADAVDVTVVEPVLETVDEPVDDWLVVPVDESVDVSLDVWLDVTVVDCVLLTDVVPVLEMDEEAVLDWVLVSVVDSLEVAVDVTDEETDEVTELVPVVESVLVADDDAVDVMELLAVLVTVVIPHPVKLPSMWPLIASLMRSAVPSHAVADPLKNPSMVHEIVASSGRRGNRVSCVVIRLKTCDAAPHEFRSAVRRTNWPEDVGNSTHCTGLLPPKTFPESQVLSKSAMIWTLSAQLRTAKYCVPCSCAHEIFPWGVVVTVDVWVLLAVLVREDVAVTMVVTVDVLDDVSVDVTELDAEDVAVVVIVVWSHPR
jgi:hypothetical protein